MGSGKKPTREDIELFRRSVGPVRKLGSDRITPDHRALPARPRRRAETAVDNLPDTFSDMFDAGKVSSEERLYFARPGLQQRLLARFRRGQLAIGDELDMHGMTVAAARGTILEFIEHSRAQGYRCVRIIHGKGYGAAGDAPILKNRLNNWLRQHHDVLAFTSATPREGGAGAVYVLLRSRRE